MGNERLPEDEAIEAAQIERRRRQLVQQTATRRLAELIIDHLEEEILQLATTHNIGDRASFLEYVEMMMGNRVIERRLAP